MKIRLEEKSLRLRLSPSEVDSLLTKDNLGQDLQLGFEQSLRFELRLVDQVEPWPLKQTHQVIGISVPKKDVREWALSVAIEWEQRLQNPELLLLIEKDLKPKRS